MPSIHRNRTVLFWTLFLSGILPCFIAQAWQVRAIQIEQSQPFGRYTAQQILDCSVTLCHIVVPQKADLSLSAARSSRIYQGRIVGRQWVIDATDPAGNDLIHINWNADTGYLDDLSVQRQHVPEGSWRRLPRIRAVHIAEAWLHAIAISIGGVHWRLEGTPKRSTWCTWQVRWRAENRTARVIIDDRCADMTEIGMDIGIKPSNQVEANNSLPPDCTCFVNDRRVE